MTRWRWSEEDEREILNEWKVWPHSPLQTDGKTVNIHISPPLKLITGSNPPTVNKNTENDSINNLTNTMEYSVIQSERESGSKVRVLWSRVSDMASRELSLVASHFLGERGEREGNKNSTIHRPSLQAGCAPRSDRIIMKLLVREISSLAASDSSFAQVPGHSGRSENAVLYS